MKSVHGKIPQIAALLVTALLVVVLMGCSEEFNTPVSNTGTQMAAPAPEFQYPLLTDELLAAGPAPGYRFLNLANSALDDNECDSLIVSRMVRTMQGDRTIGLQNFVEIVIRRGTMANDTTITMVAPSTCYAVADFYPHPYQFNGSVEIHWMIGQMNFPDGFDYSTLVPWYVTDAGEYVPVQFEWRNGYDELIVITNHFSRYILGQPGGG